MLLTGPGGNEPLIELAALTKTYRMGPMEYPALRGIDLAITSGDLAMSCLSRRVAPDAPGNSSRLCQDSTVMRAGLCDRRNASN